jgi:DNA-binding PadR family transcriptional regulator
MTGPRMRRRGAIASSQLDHVVLGLVIDKPSYGYEIFERFDRRFGAFMPASTSGIYKVLGRLEDEGLIERLEPKVPTRLEGRPRINYRATKPGASRYRAWLADRIRESPERAELLARLGSAVTRRPAAIVEVINAYERECLQEAMTAASLKPARSQSDPVSGLMEDLIVEEQRRSIAAQIAWVAYARERIAVYAKDRGSEGTGS